MKNRILFSILLLALFLRLITLNQSLWLDEAAQVIESSRPFWQQFDIAADFHPPFYHLFLHFWLLGGSSEVWIRLPSVIFSLGSIVMTYLIGTRLANKRTGVLASLFLTVSSYHVWYSQEARPYMLFVFLSLFATYLILKSRWFWYTILGIFAILTNYFTFFVFLSHLFYILFFQRKDIKNIIIALTIAAIIFWAWIPFFAQQLRVGLGGQFHGWTSVVSVANVSLIPSTFAKFILGKITVSNNISASLVLIPEMALFIISCLTFWREKSGKILLSLFFTPFVAAVIANAFIPVVAPQRLLFLLPLFYLILATWILKLRFRLLILGILIIVTTSAIGLWQYYTNSYVQRENWRAAISFIEKTETPKSVVLFAFPSPFAPYLWYYKGNSPSFGIAPSFIVSDDDLLILEEKISGKNTVYFFQYLTGLTDQKGMIRLYLSTHSYEEKEIRDFPGVGFIYRYEKI